MDLPLKKLFGTKDHKDLLIALLNGQLPAHDGLKLSLLDVKCTDAAGTRYAVDAGLRLGRARGAGVTIQEPRSKDRRRMPRSGGELASLSAAKVMRKGC